MAAMREDSTSKASVANPAMEAATSAATRLRVCPRVACGSGLTSGRGGWRSSRTLKTANARAKAATATDPVAASNRVARNPTSGIAAVATTTPTTAPAVLRPTSQPALRAARSARFSAARSSAGSVPPSRSDTGTSMTAVRQSSRGSGSPTQEEAPTERRQKNDATASSPAPASNAA